MSHRCELVPGARVLTNRGIGIVRQINRDSLTLTPPNGHDILIPWADLTVSAFEGDHIQALHRSLSPWWEGLSDSSKDRALKRMEVVLEITTGFRSGHAEFRDPGEPFAPFGPGYDTNETAQRRAMAEQLTLRGEPTTPQTLYNWLRAWERGWVALSMVAVLERSSVSRPSQSGTDRSSRRS